MSGPRMKSMVANPVHVAVMDDFKAVLTKHANSLTPQEMLALSSQLVGQLLALQDQTRMTPDMGLALIQINIEMGNAEAIQAAFTALDPNPTKQ